MGSNPIWTVDGGIGEGVNTLVCGSSMRGFDSHIPPHNGGLAQLGEHLPYKPVSYTHLTLPTKA